MRLRIAITVAMLFLYGMAFNFYIYRLVTCGYECSVLIYNYITLIMVAFCVSDWKLGFVNGYHRQFNSIGFLSIMVNYVFIILTHHKILTDPVYMFLVFNSGLVLVTAMVFISGWRHKIFR